ncbi:hypothetical protein PR002_g3817 [Phytophthora rubi]|uniref:Secreted protein n=1 Tax=Phytophthora rubi TaxID=129364 RepID=A0A6A3NGZ4_9STRA|nr:hypothetical protein PR002_g3817 [Phytophthora rubi]
MSGVLVFCWCGASAAINCFRTRLYICCFPIQIVRRSDAFCLKRSNPRAGQISSINHFCIDVGSLCYATVHLLCCP